MVETNPILPMKQIGGLGYFYPRDHKKIYRWYSQPANATLYTLCQLVARGYEKEVNFGVSNKIPKWENTVN